MAKITAAKPAGTSQTISKLLEISKLDTLYRDLYMYRARELMEALLPSSAYARTKESLGSIEWVERQLRAAVERAEWARARELTERVRTLKGSAAASGESMRLAEAVYEGAADIPLDPFSPGLQAFVGGSTQKLEEWQDQAIAALSALERQDPSKKSFYSRRGADFRALSIKAPKASEEQKTEKKKTVGAAQLQQEALSALERGDLSQLDKVVQSLMEKPTAAEKKGEQADVKLAEARELGKDLLYSFTEATLTAARSFGLAPVRTQSRRDLAYLLSHVWQPWFMKEEGHHVAKEQVSRLCYPSGTKDKRKEAIEFFLLHPFITSGGTRYEVCLVVEDLLVEDFAEPEPKEQMPGTRLLSALRLEGRRELSRIDLENALLQHGSRIIEELSLDPEAFRLVAIPADIYAQIGSEHGWGQKEIWTHFDGYQLREGGKLQALAGGDKRFGGVHDVVSFSPSYTNAKIISRFAVVQRKRMMTWHQG